MGHFIPTLELKKKDINDPDSAFPEYAGAKTLILKGALVVGNATARGRTALSVYLQDEEGKKYYFNTTARIIVNGLAPFVKGASEGYGDDLQDA